MDGWVGWEALGLHAWRQRGVYQLNQVHAPGFQHVPSAFARSSPACSSLQREEGALPWPWTTVWRPHERLHFEPKPLRRNGSVKNNRQSADLWRVEQDPYRALRKQIKESGNHPLHKSVAVLKISKNPRISEPSPSQKCSSSENSEKSENLETNRNP